jgi:nitric oxide reductase NorD protein
MVERHADLQAGQSPPERLFLSTRKSARELAVVMLLVTSFSTDAWIAGRRVLDVEIEALIVLAAALEGYVEQEVMVAAFHSQTRTTQLPDIMAEVFLAMVSR